MTKTIQELRKKLWDTESRLINLEQGHYAIGLQLCELIAGFKVGDLIERIPGVIINDQPVNRYWRGIVESMLCGDGYSACINARFIAKDGKRARRTSLVWMDAEDSPEQPPDRYYKKVTTNG